MKWFKQLIGIDLPFKTMDDLKSYLISINQGRYNLKMLEKDFYLTALLRYIATSLPEISFKWWTCLNKIHFPYFRLSEDLDFGLSIEQFPTEWPRKKFARHMRDEINKIADILWRKVISSHHGQVGGNKYVSMKKYSYLKYELEYESVFWWAETIKIECTYTNKQYLENVVLPIHDIYTDLVYWENLFSKNSIRCFALEEMIAEKTRASLTRKLPAIRDFYDLWYMTLYKEYILEQYIDIIRNKCDEANNDWTIVQFNDWESKIVDTLQYLYDVQEKELVPVLVETTFDLDTIYKQLLHIYHLLSE